MTPRLTYRAAKVGGKFAPWLNDTKGRSGVYVFRSALSGQALYVGESHTDRLYKTITRHFWSWSDQYIRPHYTVGIIFPVELAVLLLPKSRAVDEQDRLIRKLRPTFNAATRQYDDAVPF